jgi:hypothetical protein
MRIYMPPDRARRSCFDKSRYSTAEFADRVAYNQLRKRGITLYKYECGVCEGWHLSRYKVSHWKEPQAVRP